MILQTNDNLEDYIVYALSDVYGLTVAELRKKVANSDKTYSVQGIYKELRKLQNTGVVVKSKQIYSLRLPWVFDFVSLADQFSATFIERPPRSHILPGVNKKEIWHFSDLLKMNDFWSHLLVILIQQSKHKVLLGWNPHPWFHLVQTEQEGQYIRALKLARSKLYLIVGGNSLLDKWTEKFWDKETVQYSFGKSDFHEARSTYINVIDDYVITVKLEPTLARSIDYLYEKTKSIDDLDLKAVLSIFQHKNRCNLWLEKNSEKAKKLRYKFRKYWGIKFDNHE